MTSNSFNSYRWPFLLGAKFLQVHPVGTVSAILLALPAQIALIVSFLLPIKIIMLMASEGVPTFMPSVVANVDKKVLISLLAALSVASFIFHHIVNNVIKAIAKSGVIRIEKRNQKLYLFEGQAELTGNAYTRYIDTAASTNFVLLGTALLLFTYPEIAFTFLLYIIITIISVLASNRLISVDEAAFTYDIQKKLPTLSGVGFFLIFSCVLVDYIFFSVPESFIILLVSIILGRQLLTRTSTIINNLLFFHRQKQKLIALLFHRESFKPNTENTHSMLDFLNNKKLSYKELQEILKSTSNSFTSGLELSWQDSTIAGVGFIVAKAKQAETTYLIKIFDQKQTKAARHEAALLLNGPKELPSPKMITDTVISGKILHILDITGYSQPTTTSPRSSEDNLALSISTARIPSVLRSRYIRTHNMLWDQLGELRLQQIELLSKDRTTYKSFQKKIPQIQQELKSLPLRLYNPQYTNASLHIQSPSGETHLLHWGKWAIGPLGEGLTRLQIEKFFKTLADIAPSKEPHTPTDNSLCRDSLMIAFLSRELCKQIQQQLFIQSLETLEDIIGNLNRLKLSTLNKKDN